MPVPFASVCELLEEAHKACCARQCPKPAVSAWFTRNRTTIDAHDTSLAALLSTLLPEKRTDRVFFINTNSLEKLIGRGLCLRSSRIPELARHRQPGSGVDLADCVETVLTVTPNAISRDSRVTVEEIDQLLHGLASRIKFSSPAIRASQLSTTPVRTDLANLFQRLTATEGKWLTRVVLKSFAPLILDETLIFRLCDPVLPSVLQVQADFSSALEVVQQARARLLPNVKGKESARRQFLAQLKPKLGVKVGRQHWSQARSIKHCLSLGNGRMSVEDKIDGEYCQIHVDMSKANRRIQIFSKSGKDSTEDKEALHSIIEDSLDVGKNTCRFSKGCILEGEVVVYSDHERRILPFHKIRNHITRRGLFLNAEQDSLPKAGEHLMIVYYDILLLDNDSLLSVRHSERRKILSNLVKCQLGWAELAKHEIIDFGGPLAASNLRNVFAKTIINKQEGLVLKVDEPYFDFAVPERPWSGRCIKLKKEYIGGFGDVGDFAVVGAGYDPSKAKQYSISCLKWTHFYLGCLMNKDEVQRWGSTPEFNVVSVVELNQTQLWSIVHCGNPVGIPEDENDKFRITIQPGLRTNPPISCVFTQPLVVDLRCFSFDKAGNTGFWSPRFPVVSRVHLDRDYMEALSFQELQEKAKEATAIQEQPDSQENLEWIARLEGADPRGVAVNAVSQQTATTMPTPSPRRSTQGSSQPGTLSPNVPRALTRSVTQPTISFATHLQAFPGPPPPQSRPLITPPNSSDPLPATPMRQTRTQARKRSSPKASQSSHTTKRRKSSDTKQRLADSPIPKPDGEKPTQRKALVEIDINSSQCSTSTSQPLGPKTSNRETMSHEPDVIDLTSSPKAPFEPTASNLNGSRESPIQSQNSGNTTLEVFEDSLNDIKEASTRSSAAQEQVEESQASTVESQDSDHINLFFPGWDHAINSNENAQQSPQSTRESQSTRHSGTSLTPDQDEASPTIDKPPTLPGRDVLRSNCKHAGSQCYFSKKRVLLHPYLANPPKEAATLFKDHNIEDATTDIKRWLEDEHKRATSSFESDSGAEIVLLVDSQKCPSEVEALCKEINESRLALPEEKRDWITLYDWRMLKHLTTFEDDGVTNKYYDGFGTPFRRWYVGIL